MVYTPRQCQATVTTIWRGREIVFHKLNVVHNHSSLVLCPQERHLTLPALLDLGVKEYLAMSSGRSCGQWVTVTASPHPLSFLFTSCWWNMPITTLSLRAIPSDVQCKVLFISIINVGYNTYMSSAFAAVVDVVAVIYPTVFYHFFVSQVKDKIKWNTVFIWNNSKQEWYDDQGSYMGFKLHVYWELKKTNSLDFAIQYFLTWAMFNLPAIFGHRNTKNTVNLV